MTSVPAQSPGRGYGSPLRVQETPPATQEGTWDPLGPLLGAGGTGDPQKGTHIPGLGSPIF